MKALSYLQPIAWLTTHGTFSDITLPLKPIENRTLLPTKYKFFTFPQRIYVHTGTNCWC